ncbi:hypothetical protein GGU11DRAFT_751889 [Lentinula aff. detonsa]|nr:hypothetical protein GGU11DRAFT_751889 [Lentinula aff. detonsa]
MYRALCLFLSSGGARLLKELLIWTIETGLIFIDDFHSFTNLALAPSVLLQRNFNEIRLHQSSVSPSAQIRVVLVRISQSSLH